MTTQTTTFNKILIALLALIALLTVAGSALFFAPTANADNSAETIIVQDEADSAEDTQDDEGEKSGRHAHGKRHGRSGKLDALANVLGISAESLQASLEEGKTIEEIAAEQGMTIDDIKAAHEAERNANMEAKIADAVTNGDITQEEADAKLARIELKAVVSEVFSKEVIAAAKADILGVSVEELQAAHEDRSMAELVEASGLTKEEIREALQAKRAEILADAVADGTITQEQADMIGENGGCNKGRHGHGRNHNGGKNRQDSAPTVETNA